MLGCPIQTVIRESAPTVASPRAARRQVEPGLLGAVRPRLPEEAAEATPVVKIKADVVSTHRVAAEEPLGDSLEAPQEGPGEAQEDPGEDLAVPQEAPETLEQRWVVLDARTGS
jgi:hypothetical protein